MKILLGILLVVLVLLQLRLWTGAGSIAEISSLDTRIDLQDQENAGLQTRNQALKDEVSDLKNGLDSIEERARSELGLIRKGETFYLLVEDTPVREQARESSVLPPEEFIPEALPSFSPVAAAESRLAPAVPARYPEEEAGEAATREDDEEYNPYLELFRDDEAAADAASTPGQ